MNNLRESIYSRVTDTAWHIMGQMRQTVELHLGYKQMCGLENKVAELVPRGITMRVMSGLTIFKDSRLDMSHENSVSVALRDELNAPEDYHA